MKHAFALALTPLLALSTLRADVDAAKTVSVPGSAVVAVAPDR